MAAIKERGTLIGPLKAPRCNICVDFRRVSGDFLSRAPIIDERPTLVDVEFPHLFFLFAQFLLPLHREYLAVLRSIKLNGLL